MEEALRGLGFDSGNEVVTLSTEATEIASLTPSGVDPSTLLQRADAAFDHGSMIEAAEGYKFAVLYDPHDPVPYARLGRLLYHLQKDSMAVCAYRTAVQFGPLSREDHFELGSAYWRMGRWIDGVAEWRELLAAHPGSPETHERLAVAMYYQERYAQAWGHVHACEALGGRVPPQLRVLLASHMPEP